MANSFITEQVKKGATLIEFEYDNSVSVTEVINDINRSLKELGLTEKYKLSIRKTIVRVELNKDDNE